MAADQNPLRLLSLDGGGVRGLSSLVILRRIMHVPGQREASGRRQPLRPCEYFDMMAGTSTGGLIAIMLGTLRIDINECISAYLDLAPKIFPKNGFISDNKVTRLFKAAHGTARFGTKELECEIKRLLAKHLELDGDAIFDQADKTEEGCRVVACAGSSSANRPVRLRSYSSDWEPTARATSAGPLYFDPISFGSPPKKYIDDALHHNNPVRVLWDEANTVWKEQSGRNIACIISIGTGKPPPRAVGERADQLLRSLVKMVTDTEAAAQGFSDENYYRDEAERPAYFRFNVEQGLEDVGLEEWEQFEKLTEATDAYLDSRRQEVGACVNSLLSVPGM
ncbi:FabD/lysophospholipase-like protein [Glonium stellatum]|uniref:FabD/lysophospholipase-like protein n=1 Tax=Glonium stellatum TaxID=574774 RepID=A0A8E2F3T7_9PEZI|nr:FabD/lysophospholipase-like protein [Glonium stellatum]